MKLVFLKQSCKINHNNTPFTLILLINLCLIAQSRYLEKVWSFSLESYPTSIRSRRCREGRYPTSATPIAASSFKTTTSIRALYQSTRSYSNTASNLYEENIIATTNETASTTIVESFVSSSSPLTATITKYSNMSIKAIGSSTTLFVSGLFFIVLAYKRNTQMISFFIGAIMNGILSKVLKKLIQQTRPAELYQSSSSSSSSSTTTSGTPDEISNKPTDHGMPSSHAMSLGFISTFIVCNIMSLQIPLLLYTIISLYYRVQVKLHTYQQVVVGTILGSTNGFLWYRLCTGNNPFHIHIMNLVQQYLFNNQEQLPIPYLIVPFLVGAATIGSFKRRLSALLRKSKKTV